MELSTISKAQAIAAFDGNAAALARALGITPSAVYQWPEGPIAEGYALKLRFVLKPDFFAEGPDNPHRSGAVEGESPAQAAPASTPMSEAA